MSPFARVAIYAGEMRDEHFILHDQNQLGGDEAAAYSRSPACRRDLGKCNVPRPGLV